MPGLVPGIHVFLSRCAKDVDGRDKPGHDGKRTVSSYSRALEGTGVDHKAGEILIQEFVEPMGLTQGALAKATGVRRKPLDKRSPHRSLPNNTRALPCAICAAIFGGNCASQAR
jgi:hypothetical protein